MGAKLQIVFADATPFEVVVGNTATIGRTRENTICLQQNPLASRQHALIRCQNGHHYQLIDLGSSNGTFVDGQRVVMPVTLHDGARITIGDTALVFREVPDDEALGGEHDVTMVDGAPEPESQERPVALLVTDIRGFSTMAERVLSSELAQFLGAWLRETGNVVYGRAGTVDKFIGDAMLAYWAGAQSGPRDCGAAFAAARRLLAMAAERTWPGGEPFRIALALHYGVVTCSNVGTTAARDATIIGDAVNTVFRLEQMAKQLNRHAVLSQDFVAHLPEGLGLEDFGERELKGKTQAVRVFGLPVAD